MAEQLKLPFYEVEIIEAYKKIVWLSKRKKIDQNTVKTVKISKIKHS